MAVPTDEAQMQGAAWRAFVPLTVSVKNPLALCFLEGVLLQIETGFSSE